jgi:ABC-type amino acid transport substrate-binding protein
LPLFNYGNQDDAGGEESSVEFNDITVDFGTFLTKVVKIIQEIGNYGEIYNQYFPELKRDRNDLWSNGGLIYSPPFSGLSTTIPLIDNNNRNVLTEVLERGKLIFATHGLTPGFSFPDAQGNLVGFDVDLGKALAAALFGDPQAIEIKQTGTIEDFIKNNPANGAVDLAAFEFTDNIVRDTQYGIDFITPYMYTEQGILTRKDNGILNIPTLNGRKIGVIANSSSSENLKNVLAKNGVIAQIIEYPTAESLSDAYLSQEVEAATHDIPVLYSTFPLLPDPENHHLLNVKLAKDPLAMMIDENQSDWKDVVSWVQI